MSEQEYKDMQERNRIRLEQAKKSLGEKYLLHPVNFVQKSQSKE